jgi:hypothetical protein
LIVISLIIFKSRNQHNEISKNDNLKLESFLKANNKKGGFFYCKYSYVIDGSYRKIPNYQQWVSVEFKNEALLISGSERSVIDAWNLPFKYIFDEKTKILKSEGAVKYYLVNNRKIILGEDPENHVGPIRTPIKDMKYQLKIKFETYPIYLNFFDVDLDAIYEGGNLKIGLSCKN